VRLNATLLYSIGICFIKINPFNKKLEKRLSGVIYSEHTLSRLKNIMETTFETTVFTELKKTYGRSVISKLLTARGRISRINTPLVFNVRICRDPLAEICLSSKWTNILLLSLSVRATVTPI